MTVKNTVRLLMGLGFFMVASTGLAQSANAPAQGKAQPQAQGKAQADSPSNQTPETMFREMDKNNDRKLDLVEFKAGVEQRQRAALLQRLQFQFASMDKNGTAVLEADEFAELPVVKNAPKPAPTFAGTDTDHDQKVSFREYIGLLQRLADAAQKKTSP